MANQTKYIDADDFRTRMYEEAFEKDSQMQKWDSGCWIRYKLFENMIEAQLPADVVPVVKGEWVHVKFSADGNSSADCNKCGATVHTGFASSVNFCPNCGADMHKLSERMSNDEI